MERALRWFLPYIDDRGTLADVPGWGLVDWSAHYTDGRSSILTALWVRSLRAFARLSASVRNHAAANWAHQRAAAAAVGFEDFWDPERRIYLDGAPDGSIRRQAASQLASATAILSGLAPRNRWHDLASRISAPGVLVQRSWIGHPTHGFDPSVVARWNEQAPEPTWDVSREIVRAEPFGLALVHEALARAGRVPELVRSLRTWGDFLHDGYDTFGEGWGWGTHAHAWSSTPARDLLAFVAGASPRGYGAPRWRVAPDLAELEQIDVKITTRHGPLHITADDLHTIVDTPVPVDFSRDGAATSLPPGQHVLPITTRSGSRDPRPA